MSNMLPSPAPRKLGTTDIMLSPLAWGMWRFAGNSLTHATELVHAALDAGITLFDTADIYGFGDPAGFGGAEALLGEVLTSEPGLRSQMVLATKGGITPPVPYDNSDAYLSAAIEASLKRLKCDRVELYQIHRPDILAHPQEVASALTRAMEAGKIAAIGVSNMTTTQIAALQQFLALPIATTQPELSPLHITPLENGEADQAMAMDMTMLAWSPLGGGRIADPQTAREKAVAAELDRIGNAAGVSRTVAAYGWIMAHPVRAIPIVGSQRPERIADAAAALNMRWTRQDWYAVLVAARGAPLP
ncbi:MAG: aldo/keto reductase [Parasphingorhabdus sp.]|nr:aldo/keto reductase [Parasphingorhabdus sp.]